MLQATGADLNTDIPFICVDLGYDGLRTVPGVTWVRTS